MPSKKARQVYDATEGASRKHLDAISSLPAEKHVIDWDAYSKVIKGDSDVVHDLKAKYQHIAIPYPEDTHNRMGDAVAADINIKKIRDDVLDGVAQRTDQHEKDRTFFRRLPQARSMTEEMYMEAFPNRDQVKPRDRDEYEGELETVNHELKIFEKKREERAKYK